MVPVRACPAAADAMRRSVPAAIAVMRADASNECFLMVPPTTVAPGDAAPVTTAIAALGDRVLESRQQDTSGGASANQSRRRTRPQGESASRTLAFQRARPKSAEARHRDRARFVVAGQCRMSGRPCGAIWWATPQADRWARNQGCSFQFTKRHEVLSMKCHIPIASYRFGISVAGGLDTVRAQGGGRAGGGSSAPSDSVSAPIRDVRYDVTFMR